MKQFLNRKVCVRAVLGSLHGCGYFWKGVVTSYDDEFVCLDEKTYIERKYILSIEILSK